MKKVIFALILVSVFGIHESFSEEISDQISPKLLEVLEVLEFYNDDAQVHVRIQIIDSEQETKQRVEDFIRNNDGHVKLTTDITKQIHAKIPTQLVYSLAKLDDVQWIVGDIGNHVVTDVLPHIFELEIPESRLGKNISKCLDVRESSGLYSVAMDLEHTIEGGKLYFICGVIQREIEIVFESPQDGYIKIKIPRNILNSVDSSCKNDKDFIVLVNHQESDYVEEETNSEFRIITILFEANTGPIFIKSASEDTGTTEICGNRYGDFPLYRPPTEQVKIGNHPKYIVCNDELQLIFKSSDDSPACVKPTTVENLIKRGWGILQI